ncbi:sigma-54-dependent transcriptional regulator [Chlamydiota bacterium]
MEQAKILIVDDDPILRSSLKELLEMFNHSVETTESAISALRFFKKSHFDIVLSDLSLPGMDGLEFLQKVKLIDPAVIFVMITGYGTIGTTVEAMKLGAYDYITKPINDEEFKILIKRALQQKRTIEENIVLKKQLEKKYSSDNIIGQDYNMLKVRTLIKTIADTKATILLTGESGTGKTLIAQAIHNNSSFKRNPFVVVSCGALPETLLESELFGYERGAFTGANNSKDGKFKVANGGTIFLDEISVAPIELQVKLLRILEEKKFEPLGSNKTITVDVRVIVATNHDLSRKVNDGAFREDLYYRINVVKIEIPPLRERLSDIRLLSNHFANKYAELNNKQIVRITEDVIRKFQQYHWPGNIRELEHVIERAIILNRDDEIGLDDLPELFKDLSNDQKEPIEETDDIVDIKTTIEFHEKHLIQKALKHHNWHRDQVAKALGINRSTLFNKMKKYNLLPTE